MTSGFNVAMKRAVAIAALFVALAVPVAAQDFDKARRAHERGDYATALREIRPLAEQGNAVAQYNLGVAFHKGLGVRQDYVQAAKWYRKAAEQGHAYAQHNLGFLYGEGRGVPQDYLEAAKWFHKAAVQGNARAQNNLGAMFYKGHGVAQDFVQAYMWFNVAGANGDKEATENRDMVAERMTPADISEAQKLTREWMARHGKR